jgi:hypothetical protein
MAIGIYTAFAQIVEIVRGITPRTSPDAPFVLEADGGGNVSPLEDYAHGGALRRCDIDLADGGVANNDSGIRTRRMVAVSLRVLYGFDAFAGDMVAAKLCALDDADLVEQALADPRNYDEANTGLETVMGIESSLTDVQVEDDTSIRMTSTLMTYTFTFLYRRS